MSDRQYGDWVAFNTDQTFPSDKEIIAQHGSPLDNPIYSRTLNVYLQCVGVFFSKYAMKHQLEGQLKRIDLDATCAYELYQLKKLACQTDILEYPRFNSPSNLI